MSSPIPTPSNRSRRRSARMRAAHSSTPRRSRRGVAFPRRLTGLGLLFLPLVMPHRVRPRSVGIIGLLRWCLVRYIWHRASPRCLRLGVSLAAPERICAGGGAPRGSRHRIKTTHRSRRIRRRRLCGPGVRHALRARPAGQSLRLQRSRSARTQALAPDLSDILARAVNANRSISYRIGLRIRLRWQHRKVVRLAAARPIRAASASRVSACWRHRAGPLRMLRRQPQRQMPQHSHAIAGRDSHSCRLLTWTGREYNAARPTRPAGPTYCDESGGNAKSDR